MNYNFIVIEGNIGAGKTSLTKKIADQYNAQLLLEQFADNPFLPKFYKDPGKYSFPLELSFLATRYHQLKKDFATYDLFGNKNLLMADYYFTKSLIFSKNTLPDDEFALYQSLFDIIYQQLPKPDLYVYLHNSLDNLVQNIQKRGRTYEQSIQREYLEKIQKGYFDFFNQYAKDYRFLIIDTSCIDFVNNSDDYEKIAHTILKKEYPVGLNNIVL